MSGKAAVINRLIRRTGLELRRRGRTIADLASQPRRPTAGWTIEFIGTQGIGKTTLNNALYKALRSDWFFRSDLGQTGPTPATPQVLEDIHRKLYFRKVKRLKKTRADIWKSITVPRQMSRVISESLTIMANDFPRGFILDECLFKNFPDEVLSLPEEVALPLWKKRAFIYLRSRNIDFAVTRYQSRVSERARRGMLQIPPTDTELRERIEADNARFDAITGKAQKFDCPVLILYAEDDEADNIGKILAFEKTLHAKA